MTARERLWPRVKRAWAYLRSQEPARVQALWKAILGVAGAVGLAVPEVVDARVTAGIAAVWVVLTIWQGEATRREVVPADNVPPEFYAQTPSP